MDKTKRILLNEKVSLYFIELSNSYVLEASKKADLTAAHAYNLLEIFLDEGYYIKDSSIDKRRTFLRLTEKGEKLRQKLLEVRG